MYVQIRPMRPLEYIYLEDFLYESIFQPDQTNLFPKSILQKPELQLYIKDFGLLPDDYCLCAQIDGKVIGAIWARNVKGYGSIDDKTPELVLSLYKDYRSRGIGTKMLKEMLKLLQEKDYEKVSLSAQKKNYALQMYQKAGFEVFQEYEEELIMQYLFSPRQL